MERITRRLILLLAVLIALTTGCDEDHRVAQVAQQAADRQAQQNQEMAQLSRQSAEGTKLLVQADAQARKEVLAAQKNLQEQQAEVGRQRDQLEAERKEIAQARYWDPIVAQAITGAAVLLACLLPLLLAWQLLRTVRHESADPALTELLVEELASPRPVLLSPVSARLPALDAEPAAPRALACPSESGDENGAAE
jgi:hypothetical protein